MILGKLHKKQRLSSQKLICIDEIEKILGILLILCYDGIVKGG